MSRAHWLLRHAERGPIPKGESGDDVLLLPSGVRAARLLGASLGPRLVSVRTSPVLRCVHTAEALLDGADRADRPVADARLGAPGVYVTDPRLAWPHWERLGNSGVMAALVHGERLPGLADPAAAARTLLAHVLAMPDLRPGVHAWVTHDSILAPTVAHLLGIRDVDLVLPEFLEPLVILPGSSTVLLTWRGARAEVPFP
jgi:broad specificity phosphatase PhoE